MPLVTHDTLNSCQTGQHGRLYRLLQGQYIGTVDRKYTGHLNKLTLDGAISQHNTVI